MPDECDAPVATSAVGVAWQSRNGVETCYLDYARRSASPTNQMKTKPLNRTFSWPGASPWIRLHSNAAPSPQPAARQFDLYREQQLDSPLDTARQEPALGGSKIHTPRQRSETNNS
jgi:hypothetical protein